jgi:23S rRNA pseudouridine955/2504/2580 synthase
MPPSVTPFFAPTIILSPPKTTKTTKPTKPKPAPVKKSSPSKPQPVLAVRMETVDENYAGQRVDNFLLARLKGVPKSHVYRIVRSGEVRVNSKRVEAAHRLQTGDVVRIPPVRMAEKSETKRIGIPEGTTLLPHILFEDDYLIALAKPSGLAVHGGSGVSLGVIELLRREYPEQKFLELVHRLDRETSGVLLVAKKRAGLVGMHEALRSGGVEKHYLALVAGEWKNPRQHVKVSLQKYLTESGERRVSVNEDGQTAHSIFSLETAYRGATLLDAEIKTGRTHQIRVHLAHVGFPILGDAKYGDFALNKQLAAKGLKRMFLHARKLAFKHPVTEEALVVECPLPDDLRRYLDSLAPLPPVKTGKG